MAESRRHADRKSAALTAAVAAAGALVGTALLSATVLTAVVARSIIVPPKHRDEDIRILGYDASAGTIELSRTPDTAVDGRFSLWFAGDRGHARLGRILHGEAGSVTRELVDVEYGDLHAAKRGRIAGTWYLHPGDLSVGYESVTVSTELGDAPAWLIPAAASTGTRWVIQVHGRAARRHEGLRAVPVFRSAGYDSLLISYRNDGDAPFSSDGRYSLGDTEWLDVEAAMRFAVARGAEEIVLMGWSMGGATVLQAATRSNLAEHVRGIVLDSPVIDWVTTLESIAGELGVPRLIRRSVFSVIGAPWGRLLTGKRDPIDFARLDFVRRADELRLPTLILHSDDDGFVPSDGSHALADARPDIVTMETFTLARHTKLWNVDEDRWNSAIASWLQRL